VIRGGSWNNTADNTRASNRNRNTPENRNNNLGFRVARAQPSRWIPDGLARPPSRPGGCFAGQIDDPGRPVLVAARERSGRPYLPMPMKAPKPGRIS
jgi:Sulfatase-modifying factor enzyme 1